EGMGGGSLSRLSPRDNLSRRLPAASSPRNFAAQTQVARVFERTAGGHGILHRQADRFEQRDFTNVRAPRFPAEDDLAQLGDDVIPIYVARVQRLDQVAGFVPGRLAAVDDDARSHDRLRRNLAGPRP